MIELLQLLGFTILLLRFLYWVGASLEINEPQWKKVLLAQCIEGLLLLFIFSQIVGTIVILPMAIDAQNIFLGLTFVIVGAGSAFLAKRELGRAWVYATNYRIMPKQQLVTTGVYSLVRHPIYSSIALSYIGAEILVGSWLWVSFLFLFIPVFLQAKREEKLLLKHFGGKYRSYQKKTKIFIPYLW